MKFDSNACINQGVNAVEARATKFDSNLDSSIPLPTTPTQPLNLSEHVQHHIPHPNLIPNTCIPDNASRTWKKIPRTPQDSDSTLKNTLPHKRTLTLEEAFEQPNKKSSFPMNQNLNWQQLYLSLAMNNESTLLELSWAWEPTDNLGAR